MATPAAPALTGPFGTLPAELIVAVVDAVLLLPADAGLDLLALASRSAEAVRDFATTCRIVRATITSAQLREARARLRFRLGPSKRLLATAPYPYTALVDLCVRSEIEKRALQTVTREAILHCAKPGETACCAAIRRDWNARYVSLSDSARGWLGRGIGVAYDDPNSLESVALGEAMGGRSRAQVSVVDGLGKVHGTTASTECGGVLVDTGEGEVARYGTAPAVEYTPGQEFQATARVPYEGKCLFAVGHPSGNITVATEPMEEDNGLVYTITTWTADGTKKLMELPSMKSTDVAFNLKFSKELCKERGTLTSMWAQGECAWLLFEVETEGWMGEPKEKPFVACIDPRSAPREVRGVELGETARLHSFCHSTDFFFPLAQLDGRGVELGEMTRLHSFCASTASGDAAFLVQEYTTNAPVLTLSHFDATRAKVTEDIDNFYEDVTLTVEAQKNRIIMEEACLSRDGLHIVAVGRQANHLWIRIYKRVGADEWTRLKIGESNSLMHSNVPYDCTMIGPVVSPCSTKILFFHKAHQNANPLTNRALCTCNVLDLKETLYWEKWCNQHWYMWHESVPKECYWGDGLFVQARGGGVLRLGLVDEQ